MIIDLYNKRCSKRLGLPVIVKINPNGIPIYNESIYFCVKFGYGT